MKDFAKLAILFSISFVIIFLAAAGFRYLALHVSWIKTLPPRPETALTLFVAAARWALTLALFSTILFSLSYSARRGYLTLMSVLTIMGFSFFFCFSVSAIVKNWESVPPAQKAPIQLGSNGLILSNSLNKSETSVVLLKGNIESTGPRVSSHSDQPLVYQEAAGANSYFPPVPFGDNTPWFVKSLAIDIRLNSETLHEKYNEGFISFLIYAGSLIFLLSSMGYIIKVSAWPLVNLFLGILVFRGILVLESFIGTPEMLETIGSFLKNTIPVSLSIPVIFIILGALMHLYSFLVFIVRRRVDDDY